VVVQVVALDEPDSRAIALSRHEPGDGGLDVIAGRQDGPVRVWQVKYPDTSELGESQRNQIRRSLRRAKDKIAEKGGRIEHWTLAIPFSLDRDEDAAWYADFSTNKAEVPVGLLDASRLEHRLLQPDARGIHIAYWELDDDETGYLVDPTTRVRDVDPLRLDVAPAYGRHPVPRYVRRYVDDRLDGVLGGGDGGIVLLVGDSAAGKSRSAYEALVRHRPDAQIVAPDPNTSLRALAARVGRLRVIEPPRLPPVVVWLDDLNSFLRAGGLAFSDVEELTKTVGITVMATMRHAPYRDLRAQPRQITRTLDLFGEPLFVDRSAREEERRDFVANFGVEPPAEGIGWFFVRANELRKRLWSDPEAARHVVELIVDWRRATGDRPVAREALQRLTDVVHPVAHITVTDWLPKLCADEPAGTALVTARGDALTVPDLLVDLADNDERRPIDAATWRALLEVSSPEIAVTIGEAALARQQLDVATDAMEKALTSATPTVRTRAAFALAELYSADDDVVDALVAGLPGAEREETLRICLNVLLSADRDFELEPVVFNHLDEALQGLGDDEEAQSLRIAVLARTEDATERLEELVDLASGDTPLAAEVAETLGRRLQAEGALRRARDFLVRADELRGLDMSGLELLGHVLLQIADHSDEATLGEALSYFERAAEAGPSEYFYSVDPLYHRFEREERLIELEPLLLRLAARGNKDAQNRLAAQEAQAASDPDELERHRSAGEKALAEEEWDLARFHFEVAGDADGVMRTDTARYLSLADAREAIGDVGGALDAWQELRELGFPDASEEIERLRSEPD
jgi:hypothetical protein